MKRRLKIGCLNEIILKVERRNDEERQLGGKLNEEKVQVE